MRSPIQTERRMLRLSLFLVVMLMIWGMVFTEITDSNIIALDAGGYIISGLMGLITIYVSRLQDKPSDRKHPFGYGGFVPILNLMRSFMILLICLKSIGTSVGDFVNGPEETVHATVFLYAGITLLVNCIAYILLRRAARVSESPILRIDAVEWKYDVYFNISVLLSFGISYLLRYNGYGKLANHVDPAACVLLSVAMCVPIVRMFGENIRKLSVRSVEPDVYKRIRHRFSQAFPNYHLWNPEMTTIDMSGMLWVELKIDKKFVSAMDFHDWERIEQTGKEILHEISDHHHLSFRLADAESEPA